MKNKKLTKVAAQLNGRIDEISSQLIDLRQAIAQDMGILSQQVDQGTEDLYLFKYDAQVAEAARILLAPEAQPFAERVRREAWINVDPDGPLPIFLHPSQEAAERCTNHHPSGATLRVEWEDPA